MSFLKSAPRKIWSFLNVINSIIPKSNSKIFLYSNLGFRDNIKAVYDYLIENEYNEKYKIICSLNDYKAQTPQKNVRFMGNVRGLFSFFRCKYAFYCFGKYPVKPRRDQKVFNLWHGMPLKRVGNMVGGFEDVDYNYFTHLLCTAEFFRPLMKQSFSCGDESIVICGEPRTDEMMNEAKKRENDEKLLFWLPTFRKGHSDELDILSSKQFDELDRLCEKYGWKVIVKLHPLSEANSTNYSILNNIRILTQKEFEQGDEGLYTLLSRTDCLITDYSSVYFDFLLLDRPIGFAVGDIGEYGSERGFTMETPSEYMAGEVCRNGEEMLTFIESVFCGNDKYKDKRNEMNRLFNHYKDDNNCRRALEAVGIKDRK